MLEENLPVDERMIKVKTVDIVDVITAAVEAKILNEWKHDGYIDGMYCDGVAVVIDGQRYKISVEQETNTP